MCARGNSREAAGWGIPQLGSRQAENIFLFPRLTLGSRGNWQPLGFSLSGWQSAESRDGFFQPGMEFSRTGGSVAKAGNESIRYKYNHLCPHSFV